MKKIKKIIVKARKELDSDNPSWRKRDNTDIAVKVSTIDGDRNYQQKIRDVTKGYEDALSKGNEEDSDDSHA